jgi:nucleoside-diphosphate kinase
LSAQSERTLLFIKPGGGMRGLMGEHVTSGPILAMVVEGPEAISVIRRLIGETSSFKAGPGTVRGDFGISVTKNVVHASDSVENAEREISFFFKKREILRCEKPTEKKFAF